MQNDTSYHTQWQIHITILIWVTHYVLSPAPHSKCKLHITYCHILSDKLHITYLHSDTLQALHTKWSITRHILSDKLEITQVLHITYIETHYIHYILTDKLYNRRHITLIQIRYYVIYYILICVILYNVLASITHPIFVGIWSCFPKF